MIAAGGAAAAWQSHRVPAVRRLQVSRDMREARYMFSDDVRATTRAIALRMIHAGAVADSPEALAAWIARTDDIRERLTKGGYGSAFTAEDLFPLFQGAAARATSATRAEPVASRGRWVWVALAVVVLLIIAALVVATGRVP